MLSKLILLLGILVAALIAWFCTGEKKSQLQSLKEPAAQHVTVSQNSSEEQHAQPVAATSKVTPSQEEENKTIPETKTTSESEPETKPGTTAESEVSPQAVTETQTPKEETNVTVSATAPVAEVVESNEEVNESETTPVITPAEEKSEEEQNLSSTPSEISVQEPETQTEVHAPAPEIMVKKEPETETFKEEKSPQIIDVQHANIENTQTQINEIIRKKPILFRTGSSELTLDSKKILDRIVDLVNQNSEEIARLRIAGHTDASGPASYNKRLSQKRAEVVRDYLIQHNIKVPHIEAIGYGEEQPITDNPYAKENRRVEITIQKGE